MDKILKPFPGLAYFEGQTADFPDEVAKDLIDKGYVVSADAKEPESDLPESLPGRVQLIKSGLYTKKQVISSKETLADIPGIGLKTASAIIEQLTE